MESNWFKILPGHFLEAYLEALGKEEDGLFFTIISHVVHIHNDSIQAGWDTIEMPVLSSTEKYQKRASRENWLVG